MNVYRIFEKKLEDFWESLNEEQRSELWCLWDNGIFEDPLFEKIVDEIIIDERE